MAMLLGVACRLTGAPHGWHAALFYAQIEDINELKRTEQVNQQLRSASRWLTKRAGLASGSGS